MWLEQVNKAARIKLFVYYLWAISDSKASKSLSFTTKKVDVYMCLFHFVFVRECVCVCVSEFAAKSDIAIYSLHFYRFTLLFRLIRSRFWCECVGAPK